MTNGGAVVDELTLFDAAPFLSEHASVEPTEPLSADRRRTVRQAATIAAGGHPLQLIGPGIRVHPDAAGPTATKDNANTRPLRCGTCAFRRAPAVGDRSYPKCIWRPDATPEESAAMRTPPPRFARSAATDVRAWWPACTDYVAVIR